MINLTDKDVEEIKKYYESNDVKIQASLLALETAGKMDVARHPEHVLIHIRMWIESVAVFIKTCEDPRIADFLRDQAINAIIGETNGSKH